MGEQLGAPDTYEEQAPVKRRYPWTQWSSRPFTKWMLTPGVDFPISGDFTTSARKMDATIRTWAFRKGLGVSINAVDPEGKGRLVFCFYDKADGKRPSLSNYEQFSSNPAITSAAAEESDIPTVTCAICGAVQQRVQHLMHVPECLIRNPDDPTDSAYYARHREDSSNTTGMRKINPFTVEYSEKDGPT